MALLAVLKKIGLLGPLASFGCAGEVQLLVPPSMSISAKLLASGEHRNDLQWISFAREFEWGEPPAEPNRLGHCGEDLT